MNNYYDKSLKIDRLKILKNFKLFKFYKNDVSNFNKLKWSYKFHKVVLSILQNKIDIWI